MEIMGNFEAMELGRQLLAELEKVRSGPRRLFCSVQKDLKNDSL
jgi:hypothetical protein